MSNKVASLRGLLEQESQAKIITYMYTDWKTQRKPHEDELKETREYIFATSTHSITSNASAADDWLNSTHIPKIAQIRDNLHANYMLALFPNDDWLQWEAASADAATKKKRKAILAYMKNKLREQRFYETMSDIVYDYIDKGNAIADVEYINKVSKPENGEPVQEYVGPVAVRIDPLDIVFNLTATSFQKSPKITRSIVQIGELKTMMEDNPEDSSWAREAFQKAIDLRSSVSSGGFNESDFYKADAYNIEGFGSLLQYYQSGYVELLEFEGDLFDPSTGAFERNKVITVMDRQIVVRRQTNPSWLGRSLKEHVGWRKRPDNLFAQGPLANIIGMQYRLNQLENAKADTIDMNLMPFIVVRGESPEDIEWRPRGKLFLDAESTAELLRPDLSAINIDTEVQWLMDKMEEFVGAPREALGIRSPGEKTAFEVQTLTNAADRLFARKVINIEVNLLEPLLNSMLEVARRNLDVSDQIRVQDDDTGVVEFMTITKEDITAAGKLYPIGARHLSDKARNFQNLVALSNSNIWQDVRPHLSGKEMAKVVEDQLGFRKYDLFSTNIGIEEQAETAALIGSIEEEQAVADTVPVEDDTNA